MIHGPDNPRSYVILFLTALGFTFIMRHIHNCLSFLLWPNRFFLSIAISNCPPLFPSGTFDSLRPWGGGSYSGVIPFCLFMLFMGFSQQEYRRCLPFPPPVDHVLSELSSMTYLFWMVLHGMAHSVSVLCKPLCHNKAVIQERGFRAYCYIKGQHLHLKLNI